MQLLQHAICPAPCPTPPGRPARSWHLLPPEHTALVHDPRGARLAPHFGGDLSPSSQLLRAAGAGGALDRGVRAAESAGLGALAAAADEGVFNRLPEARLLVLECEQVGGRGRSPRAKPQSACGTGLGRLW